MAASQRNLGAFHQKDDEWNRGLLMTDMAKQKVWAAL
jgi:hypothetical protein